MFNLGPVALKDTKDNLEFSLEISKLLLIEFHFRGNIRVNTIKTCADFACVWTDMAEV